jgi:hypothetical protein
MSGLPDMRTKQRHVGCARYAQRNRETQEVTAMTKARKATLGRREFLRTLGAGAGVAAAAAGPLAIEAKADTETNDEKRKSRYRETEHVKTFYRVNRYPS